MESTDILIPGPALPPPALDPSLCLSATSNPILDGTKQKSTACPWAALAPVAAVSLNDVMSEQLAFSLQKEQEQNLSLNLDRKSSSDELELNLSGDPDCNNDFMLAQLLQMEFDKEHDDMLSLEEKKFNGISKVSVSFDKYRVLHDNEVSDDDDDDYGDVTKKHWDSFEKAEKNSPAIGKSGISRQGNTITTKHDPNVCGMRNARRVMELPGISTGDGGSFNMKLSNNVYNSLKVHSLSEVRRAHRLNDKKEKSTAEIALDPKTRLLLYKLVNNRILEDVNGCISTGKEAVVFHAHGGDTEKQVVPKECAIKVYKTTLNEFKNRSEYIRGDYRFRVRFNKQDPQRVIHMWAEKEMRNLSRIKKAGIPCPDVVVLKKHILVMSFIGENQQPAPKIKELKVPLQDMCDIYEQTVDIMKKLYRDCQLVHADLSQYNLLWHDGKVWVIDVSQSVENNHPHSLEFLYRDCTNITEFFEKQGVPKVLAAKDLFREVCGLHLPGEGTELLSQIQNYERDEELLAHSCSQKGDAFEILFAKVMNKDKFGMESDIPSKASLPSSKD